MSAPKSYTVAKAVLEMQIKEVRKEQLYYDLKGYLLKEVLRGETLIKISSYVLDGFCPYKECKDFVDDVFVRLIEEYKDDIMIEHEVNHKEGYWEIRFNLKS